LKYCQKFFWKNFENRLYFKLSSILFSLPHFSFKMFVPEGKTKWLT